jgi:hypothetical protein
VTLHAVIGAPVTLGAQQLVQPPRRQPFTRRLIAVGLEQSIKPRDKLAQPRLRLNLALVAKLRR